MRWLENPDFNFLKYRKAAFVFSGSVVVISLLALIFIGPEFGIEFKGGKSYVIQFEQPVEVTAIREVLEGPLQGSPEVKQFGSNREILIQTDATGEIGAVQSIITANLRDRFLENDLEVVKSSIVGPRFADDLRRGAVNACIFGAIVIFIYILIRFKSWPFSVGAVVAIVHDVLAVLGIFIIFKDIAPFSMEIDQTMIAAFLTILGYSINDTVIVYDRIRENLQLHKGMDFKQLVNKSLNDTLSRTVVTGISVFFVVIVLFLFGGEVLKGFSFALLIGGFFGLYSSLFVATNLVIELDKRAKKV